ncbi:SDR family NAD(P)-dependent oxidoreductase [Halalkalibacterium halodurans]|uniref:SDR family NAD(P)-dependent oxidoreductase n=1 Tax=Halalkalibacterium halodurans TaxID=86665 RepID=UPI002AAA0DCB|nr:SDR family oxidoreductase [Halalkalibacterium halodurans]MDY7222031.1 SDR family oxidoreductase [Halalkalibacterium halodurans]MDY7241307.1 SDR family oxidoreductase [Halalkalibacterium halodurans]
MTKRIVLVTGAAQGIGTEIAAAFAAAGDRVILADVNVDKGHEAAERITQNGEARFIHCDVKNISEINHLFAQIRGEEGSLDVLINNAGISIWKNLFDVTEEAWDEVIHTNVRSVFFCSQQAARLMKEGGGGAIINIASTRAFMSEPDSEMYAAAKGGVIALTHALAASLQPYNIRVNSISPGWIHTGKREELRPIDHKQHFSNRVGTPADIASACLFLASNEQQFINGENLIIDGGMTKKMIYEP